MGADDARMGIAELEKDRSRALIHDLLVYLRLDRFAQEDNHTRAVMIARAQAKHEQMRSYVDGTGGGPAVRARIEGSCGCTLVFPCAARLRSAGHRAVGRDPGSSGTCPGHRAGQRRAARQDANVVLSVRSGTDLPSVMVRDDGDGFDAASSPPGFGISEILGRQLAGVGGTSVVESCPGAGTVVRITVPAGQP